MQVAIKPKKRKEGEGKGAESGKRRRSGGVKLPKKKPGDEGYDPYDFTSSESEGEGPAPPTSRPHDQAMETGPVQMSVERWALIRIE